MMPADRLASAALAHEATATAREVRKPLISRVRFQLGGALLLGLVLPLLLRWPILSLRLEHVTGAWQVNTAIAAAGAIISGYYLVRNLNIYPGTRATAYVFPCMIGAFGFVAAIIFFSRIEYSRYMFGASLLISTLWLYFALLLQNRYAKPTLALVPCGNLRGIEKIGGATWRRIATATEPLNGVEAVVVDLRAELPPDWGRFIGRCILAGLPVYNARGVVESLTGRVEINHLSESSFGSVVPSNLFMRLKRLVDFGLVAVLAAPASLVMLVACIGIRLESPGPVFFRQPRMGFRGHTFTCWKLRSMRFGAEVEGQHYTEENDPRITRVGRVIRKYRIDELPQIWNIVTGDMSWIGPRPEAISLAECYAREIPFYIYRHAVRPGISGWAQVNQGNVADVDAATIKLQYDFYYIKNFSPWLDLLIFLRTLRTVVTGFGSK